MAGPGGMHGWSTRAAWSADAAAVARDEAPAIADAASRPLVPGRCDACGSGRGFANPGGHMREGLACRACGCNARQRAAARLMLASLADPRAATVRVTEQASRLFLALRDRVGGLRGSEYLQGRWQRLRLSAWLWRHGVVDVARHGDVNALRDADASCDGVLSLDVLEHVPACQAALREFARVLRPGGILVLTVPFHEGQPDNRCIARRRADGSIEHVGPPEYHGDPLTGGIVCFHHFGWQLLDDLRAAGFAEAVAHRVQDPSAGLPQGQWVLLARRQCPRRSAPGGIT